jgi:hypothetical protein
LTNLLAWYTLKNGSLLDSTGTYNLTGVNSPTTGAQTMPSGLGGAPLQVESSATGATNKIAQNTSLKPTDLSGGLSLSFWYNGSPMNTYPVLLGWYGVGSDDRTFLGYLTYTTLTWNTTTITDGRKLKTFGASFEANALNHVVITFDPSDSKTRGYVNGNTTASMVYDEGNPSKTLAASDGFCVGSPTGWPFGNTHTAGVCGVGVWSKKLSSSEIQELYNAGAGKFYPFA